MKKVNFMTMVAVCMVSCAAISFAQEMDQETNPTMNKDKDAAKSMKCGMGKMCAMKCMMPKSMAVTKENDIIIMTGHTLLKYDKNLELKKEVEIKNVMQMERLCPKCQMMMKDKTHCVMCGQSLKEGEKETTLPRPIM